MRLRLARCAVGVAVLFALVHPHAASAVEPGQDGVAEKPAPMLLLPQAQVTSAGIFLDQLVAGGGTNADLHVWLADAPAVGRSATYGAPQIQSLIATQLPAFAARAWAGASVIQITRRMRMLTAAEVVEAVKARIGKTYSRDQGELELRFSRPWTPTPVPDEEFSFRVSDPPATGLSPSMQFRFEVVLNDEVLGSWQTGMDAKLWRDVWICRQPLRRGAPLRETDISIERRDVLRQSRDLLPANLGSLDSWEVAETLNPGQPLLNRSLAPRVVVSRGQTVDALFRDGTMTVSVKAETLENGAPGQLIRIRNLSSRRELRGRVINEQTVHIQL